MSKNQQLQIRISAEDKARIQERAARAGMDVSNWVLNLVLPPVEREFQTLCRELSTRPHARSYVLAEVQDSLERLNRRDFERAVHHAPEFNLPTFEANYLAAIIEETAMYKGTVPPGWTKAVPPLEEPWFASSLMSLRLYLLTNSPPPFRRRNLFVDSSVGQRI
ncbi:MAG: hypothetical protein OXF11_19705 [Deltaproteobacteria bacterium]|nr:hypothetical protein [Deltaproteobacteria bacterium]